MIKCNNCNNQIPDDSEFCQYCGASIASLLIKNMADETVSKTDISFSAPVTSKTNSSNKKALLSIICTLSICAAIILGLMYFNLSNNYSILQDKVTQQETTILNLRNDLSEQQDLFNYVNRNYKLVTDYVNSNIKVLAVSDNTYHYISCRHVLSQGCTKYLPIETAPHYSPMCLYCLRIAAGTD